MKIASRPHDARRALSALCVVSGLLPTTAFAAATAIIPGDQAYLRPNSTLSGPTRANAVMTIALILPSRDAAGAAAFANHVSQPGDPLFRHPLTPAQFATRFGALPAQYAAVAAWATSMGLTQGEAFSAHTIMPLSGKASVLAKAFGITFNNYLDAKGATYYAANQPARVPVAIAGMVNGVLGLSSANHFVPQVHLKPANAVSQSTGTGADGGFSALDLRTAYAIQPQAPATSTQVVGLFEQGGFYKTDVAAYVTANKLPAIQVIARSVNGYGTAVDDPTVELEAVLDIDMVMAMNPAAKKIIVYEDGADAFQVALLDGLSAMATEGVAKTISVSYGVDEALQSPTGLAAENTVLTQLAAQGQAVFASAGDYGAYGDEANGLHVMDPSSQPFVTAVGGTTLFTNNKQQRLAEETWNNIAESFGATGGGISDVWSAPSYQTLHGPAVMTTNGGSATMRNVPDVAAVGNPLTGVAIYASFYGGWTVVGGTSVAAPIWAGTYSLAAASSEALGFGPPGFANPTLYALGNGAGLFQPDFIDIEVGTNGFAPLYGGIAGFSAGPGFDNVTGWGTMFGQTITADIAVAASFGGTNPPAAVSGLRGVATSSSITVDWQAARNASGYAIECADTQTGLRLANNIVHKPTTTYIGLQPNTIYEFVVLSVSTGGDTYSVPIFIKTLS